MTTIAIIGASGYAGATLAKLIATDDSLTLGGLYVSEASVDAGTPLSSLYPEMLGLVDQPLQGLSAEALQQLCQDHQGVCLATEHQVSATLVPTLLEAGLSVFDLSGGHRFKDAAIYPEYYGFEHPHPEHLLQAEYGLVDWYPHTLNKSKLIAVPGCYPTASLLALKPLQQAGLLAESAMPVINAVSGVSGAGRKAQLNTHFCQVSLTPYGVLGHRHQPEIETYLGHPVVFTPHLGNFKRGILATIVCQLKAGITDSEIAEAYAVYQGNAGVKLLPQGSWPKVDDVAGSDRCLLAWKFDAGKQTLVVASAIDNLMKGAASQALDCINIHFGHEVYS
ncbi:N-acetyl-gamma-glutamyl-phosphate reductase [Ferrimonas sp. SCSIO 43195]|uniref:N-acetyl-gamma-glutamyl-phosphate reductase n=1 Tax=Ferrimonas sp. SCSIO 43195 TaxID=2822844 RepID=UPI002074D062|nr:N-acetyl-gamma-glutamyl-phosphate reductase [Ferrimonas sp. SCSIO 43195]USD37881.1 N-acetyl-gamma-glutamyl-phosphate reductase [Ferrimonas sp. SCSIO 43195]